MLRQETFITAILGNPGLALLVQSLTWTLLQPRSKELHRNPLLDYTSERVILRIWDAFQRLTGVKTLDLAWLSRDHGDPLADGYPNGLFPAATSIRLSGVMHYSFAASILYNNPAKLIHLTLDNLQQVGKGCDHFLYRRVNQRQDYQQRPSIWNHMISQYGATDPFGPAGPMQNLLGPLTGRCPNLRTLTFRKVEESFNAEFTPEFEAKDEDIYLEFATFIVAAQKKLQHVVFEQGERTAQPPPPHPPLQAAGPIVNGGPPPLPLPAGQMVFWGLPRPMDTLFLHILYPFLFDQTWPHYDWSNLESMTIGGVHATWTAANSTIRTSGGSIRAAIRSDVAVMDHIGLGDPLAGVIR